MSEVIIYIWFSYRQICQPNILLLYINSIEYMILYTFTCAEMYPFGKKGSICLPFVYISIDILYVCGTVVSLKHSWLREISLTFWVSVGAEHLVRPPVWVACGPVDQSNPPIWVGQWAGPHSAVFSSYHLICLRHVYILQSHWIGQPQECKKTIMNAPVTLWFVM